MILSRSRFSPTKTLVFALALLVGALPLAASANGAHSRKAPYLALVRWTSYGIPHVTAIDWGSLGYGYGYAFAHDNLCTLAQDVVESTGEQSRWFGPGGGRLESDWLWALFNSDAVAEASWQQLDADLQSLLQGYADGYNRDLAEVGVANLPEPCRDAGWVRPIDALDMLKVLNKLTLRAGVANFIPSIVGAQPPAPLASSSGATSAPTSVRKEPTGVTSLDEARTLLARTELPDWSSDRFGSNAVALGRDLTNDGGGALLGNPHFPWLGINRFHLTHLTIPGRYDAMGAAIYGFPLVNIGFNRNVAWSHTVSTARRFVVFELTLAPGDPTSYVFDGAVLPMTTQTVTVDVLQGDGSLAPASHTFYSTRWGPMLVLPPLAGWSTTRGYTIADVNVGNIRGLRQYREMGSAHSVAEFRHAIESNLALPWVNSIAADRQGNAYYGDISTVPHVTDAKLAACANTFVAQVLSSVRVYTLDGSTSACDLGSDPDAPQPGIFGPSHLPSIQRGDFAQNSNDSYWLANPAQRLEGYPQIIGVDEGRPQGLRTRLGLRQIEDRMLGTDGLPGSGFGRQWLQDVLYQNRNLSAELLLDGVRTLCMEEDNHVDLGGGNVVDVSQACAVLASWDGTNDPDRVGPHIWLELYDRASGTPNLYAVPFDANDPVNTPRDLNLGDAAVRSAVMASLAGAVDRLVGAGIALDAPWGTVQFDTRNGEIFPIPGGPGGMGVYNAIYPAGLVPNVGYTPIVSGSSYIQAVRWKRGWPDVRGIVTYSQSTNPDSPHFSDMTRVFSDQEWLTLPFRERDIRREQIDWKFLWARR